MAQPLPVVLLCGFLGAGVWVAFDGIVADDDYFGDEML